jgi:hypothetical protein
MSQLFDRNTNIYSRLSIVAALVFAGVLGTVVGLLYLSGYHTKQDEYVAQPIQFSHAHHVGGVGLDCRYCHTSVEESSFANIPPTKTCMNCHSQLWNNAPILEPVRASLRDDTPLRWTRVYDLPDFVYFNHSIHVKKGVGCETCHGRVDRMPLMFQQNSLQMEWCLDCHRDPAKFIRPREEIVTMGYRPDGDQREIGERLMREYKIAGVAQMTSCSVCHR